MIRDPRRREELQHGRRDDAKRSFRADEQLLEVIPGIVLAQAAQAVPDPAIGKHDLDAKHEIAGIPEAQHGRAAGIGGQVAADRAASLRGE